MFLTPFIIIEAPKTMSSTNARHIGLTSFSSEYYKIHYFSYKFEVCTLKPFAFSKTLMSHKKFVKYKLKKLRIKLYYYIGT